MIGNKLQNILKSWTHEDKKQFLYFIQSPFFNKKEELIVFYQYLQDNKSIKFEISDLCNKIFQNPITEKKLGYLISDLIKLIENYFINIQFQKNRNHGKQYLLNELKDRELNKHFEQKITQYQKQNHKIKNATYYQNKYLKYKTIAHFQTSNLKKRKFDPNVHHISTHFDKYFIITKLMIYCNIINRKNMLSGDFELSFFDEIFAYIDNKDLRKNTVIDIYYTMVKMLNNEESNKHFAHLNKLVSTKSQSLPKDELYEIYLHLINFCLQKIRNGQKEFVKNALLLYNEAIESGVFLNNNSLSPWRFNNVIKLAIIDNQYEWAKKFIDENKEKLPKEFRSDAINYNLAQLLYNEDKYDKALQHLNLLKYTDFSYRLGSREILAKIYYEKDEEEALLSLIASFTIFLKRNKNISSNLKVPFLNFCDLLNQILRRNPKKLQKIKEKIIDTKVVTSKSWLLSTVNKELTKLNLPIE